MNASSTFYCLLICWVATSAAAADLPILDTFPRCDYQLVQQFDITEQRSTDEVSEPEDQQKLLAQVIHLIRRNSADAGAEAIILQHVDGDKLMLKNSVRRKTGSFELRLNARADAITLCEEDPELPLKATPFNERGNRNAVLNTQSINIPIAFTLNATSDTGSPGQPLEPLVSLQHGFHGVLPGMTKAELKAIWGQPDAEFQLQPEGYQALAYGKQYWLLLYQDEVVSIDSRHSLLSADITRQLNDNQAFSHLAWQLDGHFEQRTPLTELKAQYQQLKPLADNLFSLQQGDHQLQMEFADYLDIRSGTQQTVLSQLRLHSVKLTPSTQQQLAVALPQSQLRNKSANPFTRQYWQNTLQAVPVLNRAMRADGDVMTIYNASLAAVFQRQQVKEIQLLSVYQGQDSDQLQQTLKNLGMPRSKAAFLQRFPDAFDALGKLIYYGDQLEVSALYSETEGSRLENITIRFM
ncbi:MAG TPA: hypothetical protein VFY01_02665 [Rheinheimera sp.]|nr:hypothetical protein [Rheinheimera sp.]